jgi:hypothetical protein
MSWDPIRLAGGRKRFDTLVALLVTGRALRSLFSAEAEKLPINDRVYILGKTLNQFPTFGKRCAAFESQVRSGLRQREQLAKDPADPEVFLHAGRIQSERVPCNLAKLATPIGGKGD